MHNCSGCHQVPRVPHRNWSVVGAYWGQRIASDNAETDTEWRQLLVGRRGGSGNIIRLEPRTCNNFSNLYPRWNFSILRTSRATMATFEERCVTPWWIFHRPQCGSRISSITARKFSANMSREIGGWASGLTISASCVRLLRFSSVILFNLRTQ